MKIQVHARRAVFAVAMASFVACGGGEGGGPSPNVPDAALTPDAAATPDAASTPDAAATPDAGSPTATAGWIQVFDDAVFGYFRNEATIVRVPDAPACVIHIQRSPDEWVAGGNLTVAPVGPDGTPRPFVITAAGGAYEYFGPTFASDDRQVEIAIEGTASFAALPKQSVRTPTPEAIEITRPVHPDPDGYASLKVSAADPFEIAWNVPAGDTSGRKIFVLIGHLFSFASGMTSAFIFCGFDLAAGTGTVPPSVFAEVVSRIGRASGLLHIGAGDQREVAGDGFSYVIEVARPGNGTSPPFFTLGFAFE
jgi:hypothetical protein